MKKRNTFLIFLLCLTALIILSGCASRNADTAVPPEPREATSVAAVPETPADTEETPVYADTKEQPIVTMTIELDKELTYTLTPEDSSRVIALFEGAEKESLDSPIADFTELYFQFGENHLAAPLSDFDPFRGMLDGERVVFTLDEESCDTLREIIRRYTDLDTPAAGLDTPSAGEV